MGEDSKDRHTFLQAEIGCWTIGWPANGKRGFGTLKERGRNRVPAVYHSKTEFRTHKILMPFSWNIKTQKNWRTKSYKKKKYIKGFRYHIEKIQFLVRGSINLIQTKTKTNQFQKDKPKFKSYPWSVHPPWSQPQLSPQSYTCSTLKTKTQILKRHKCRFFLSQQKKIATLTSKGTVFACQITLKTPNSQTIWRIQVRITCIKKKQTISTLGDEKSQEYPKSERSKERKEARSGR